MKRRAFITLLGGAAACWPLTARAQQLPVIGFFSPSSAGTSTYMVDGLRRGLAETGYVEGRNLTIEYRWAEGHYDRLPELAAELVRRRVDVIFASGSSAPGLAAKAATSTIPIVFQAGGDPVTDGFVPSMNRPGANVTGVSRMTVLLDTKRVDLLHEAVPKVNAFALLVNRDSPRTDFVIEQVQKAARSLGLGVVVAKVEPEHELDEAFAAIARERAGALLVSTDPAMDRWRQKTVVLTTRHVLPTMFSNREYVAEGGLMSYDSSLVDSFRQAGNYVGRILKGEKPADLPVLQPTKFDFMLNLKTARRLALRFRSRCMPSPTRLSNKRVLCCTAYVRSWHSCGCRNVRVAAALGG
jgi:putative ABC transport system substrate-binding protein